jgi:DNA-binding HxlR family transcriptional regulator
MRRGGYDQFCGAACALDLVGDRWALLVVRELLFGPKRFTDLLAGLPGIGTNTLAARVSELEEGGVVRKRHLPAPLAVTVFELTERGRELEPVLVALARWGTRPLMAKKPRHELRPAWLALALRTYFDPSAPAGRPIRVGLVLPQGALTLELGEGALRIAEGETAPLDLRIETTERVFLDVLRGASTFAAAAKKRTLAVEGDVSLLSRLLAAFPLGPPRGA